MDLLRGLISAGLLLLALNVATGASDDKGPPCAATMVARECWRALVTTDSGTITAVDVHDGYRGPYHLQFITLEPGSLFLPVLLHTDMAFYVHTGRGSISYISKESDEDDEPDQIDVMRGDVYRLEQGTIFYMQSHAEPTREKLRIHAIFNTADIMNPMEILFGAYSNISDLVRGFDSRVLQMGFQVSEEAIQEIKSSPASPSIVPVAQKNETGEEDKMTRRWEEGELEALLGFLRGPNDDAANKKKKKSKSRKAFNFFDQKPDVQNANGWSSAVTHKDLKALKDSNFGAFMVNLTRGSMMGPHWNPRASEVAVVIQGQGMVQVVCPSNPSGVASKCRQRKFRVREGDVFVVPRYHAMVQVSYNNGTFVFAGFSSMSGKNHPQFLAGKRSVLQTVDRDVLTASFNTRNATIIDDMLASQDESIILACTSCAEELERKMEEEIEKERQEEEAKRREEEEARRRQEEAKRRQEEEEARKREEEEEARRREEEEAKRRQEEEAKKRQEEEEARRREEEEAKKRQEEEEARRRQEEEEARRREKEEAKRRRQKEEEARRREEEEEARRREEEEARRREHEEEARRQEEEARRQEEEEATRREQEEEEAARREAEEEEEEARRREREEEEARRREREEEEEEEGGGGKQEGEEEEEYEPARREREEAAGGGGDEEAEWILLLQQQQRQVLNEEENDEEREEKLMEMARRLATEAAAAAERW